MIERFDLCSRPRAGFVATLIGLLIAVAIVYLPGLSGDFLLDDHSTLRLLAESGRVRSFDDWVRYLGSGFSGPSGRPVALASFLLDGHHWPEDATIPKLTNLLIHLVNTILLSLLTARLLAHHIEDTRRRLAVVVLAAGLWALHPLWVSTTLYVVQRMTLLAAGFAFAALLLYLVGRDRLAAGRTGGPLLMALGLFGCGTLAVLSKENAAVLPLLVLVLERYGLTPMPAERAKHHRYGLIVLAGIPALLVIGYLASLFPALLHDDMAGRQFTAYERFLTQGRVLLDYLIRLWLPYPHGTGLYHDDFPVSTGLFTPWITLPAWLLLVLGAWFAEHWRARFPLLATAYMFFLFGQLIESSWIPLELYFEHRNYLPAALMFVPLAAGIIKDGTPHTARLRATAGMILVLCALLTLQRSDLWGRPFLLALSWAQQHPDSIRAQTHLAQLWLKTGNTNEASRLLDRVLARYPDELLIQINRLAVDCQEGRIGARREAELLQAIAHTDFRYPVRRYQLITLSEHLTARACPVAGTTLATRLLDHALQQPSAQGQWRAELLYQRGKTHLAAERRNQALADFHEALRLYPSHELILLTAAELASHQLFDEALIILERTRPLPPPAGWSPAVWRAHWLERRGYWKREYHHLRTRILDDRRDASCLPQG